MKLTLLNPAGREVHVDATKIVSAWHKGNGGKYVVKFGKEDALVVDKESYEKVVEWLDWEEGGSVMREDSLSVLSGQLRNVIGLHGFAELFGFDWEGGPEWTWHDVAVAMADRIDGVKSA